MLKSAIFVFRQTCKLLLLKELYTFSVIVKDKHRNLRKIENFDLKNCHFSRKSISYFVYRSIFYAQNVFECCFENCGVLP